MSTPECRKDCDVYADWQKMEGDTAGHLLAIARLKTRPLLCPDCIAKHKGGECMGCHIRRLRREKEVLETNEIVSAQEYRDLKAEKEDLKGFLANLIDLLKKPSLFPMLDTAEKYRITIAEQFLKGM